MQKKAYLCAQITKQQEMIKSITKLFFLATVTFGISACAPRTATNRIAQPAGYAVPELSVPVPEKEFAFIIPRPELMEHTVPQIKINENFSYKEKNHVRACETNLFAKEAQLTLNLELIEESDFAFPLPGGRVISPYGTKRRNHTGIDIKTRANDTIVSAFDGIVRMAKAYSGYGNVIVVRHYNGLETVYSHNSKNLVKSGDHVKAGTPIALTGRTGRATTEHLHFETRINGEYFDPNTVIDFQNRTLKKRQLVITQTKNGKVAVTPASIAKPIS